MNKVILPTFCLIYLFISNYAYSDTCQDNYVYFTGDTKSAIFHVTNHFITKHQPFKGVYPAGISLRSRTPVAPKGLLIKAGRHGSSDVVINVEDTYGDNIFSKIKSKNHDESARSTFGHEPGNLNFAVLGNLIINGKQFNSIVLAQGHAGASNDWWFAGENCTHYNDPNEDAADCLATDGTDWCFTRGHTAAGVTSTAPNHIKLSKKSCESVYHGRQ